MAVRLQKYLAECGVASRRASERLIEQGRVTVNGETAVLGQSVDPGHDAIALDGRPIAQDTKICVLLNKPAGVITTAQDTHGRKTVLDCVQGARGRVFPVGRLDMDVKGVLLLTNDGELAHRLMHPSYEVEKEYLAWVNGQINPATVRQLEEGIPLEDGKTSPARVRVLHSNPDSSRIFLTLHEGRKREVKRMCAAVGHPVRRLERVVFAGLTADGLRVGEWRYLTPEETRELRARVGL